WMRRVRDAVSSRGAALAGEESKDRESGDTFAFTRDMPVGPPPIWLAALGDRMIELAGEVADGVLLNWCTPERVHRAAAIVTETASRVGREPPVIGVYVRGCLGAEEALALEALRAMTGQYAAM